MNPTKAIILSYKDVASFFLAFANESGEGITNLKLQKLVYYAQAWYLANYSDPLFDADFQAWVHGPVIPEMYHDYKDFGSGPVVTDIKMKDFDSKIDGDTKEYLDEVAKVYMPYGGYQLELMTHNEKPWTDARAGIEPDQRCENLIPKEAMREFYGQKIKN